MTAVTDQNDAAINATRSSLSPPRSNETNLYNVNNSIINTKAISSNSDATSEQTNSQDVFQIAAKAEKLLQEILSANKTNKTNDLNIKQEPIVQNSNNILATAPPSLSESHLQHHQFSSINNNPPILPQTAHLNYSILQQHQQNNIYYPSQTAYYQQPQFQNTYQNIPQYIYSTGTPTVVGPSQTLTTPPTYVDHSYFQKHPPPINMTSQTMSANSSIINPNSSVISQPPHFSYYQQQQHLPQTSPFYHQFNPYHQNQLAGVSYQQQLHYQPNPYIPYNNINNGYQNKRKFSEINNGSTNNYNSFNKKFGYNTSNNHNSINNPSQIKSYNSTLSSTLINEANTNTPSKEKEAIPSYSTSNEENNLSGEKDSSELSKNINLNSSINLNEEEEDLNIMRERELKDLKCKSVVEKMSVFFKYYQQFKDSYIQRVQTIECSDSLKIQFHSLIKYLNEYESLLAELDMMITEHERNHCKNNHRKTKKFFNKTKAFIRYECNKRLQSNIFEYRRLINSQDRYAGMYDLLDMNSYLISLLPDIGVSIRRYINRCEKAREQEQLEEDDYAGWQSDNSNDSLSENQNSTNDVNNLKIPTFKEFVALNADADVNDEVYMGEKENSADINEENNQTNTDNGKCSSTSIRNYESFSKGIDHLNRYLLKRVEDEESLDELVKERILKWINKRQAKYILIFSEVDKLLNQHKGGECYPKFHSYLLFNLGKLVTVCDSYHQKLKELLYSTTIRRKKKRKKVKLLPEAMVDVFDEIIELKRILEHTKISIKRCNVNK